MRNRATPALWRWSQNKTQGLDRERSHSQTYCLEIDWTINDSVYVRLRHQFMHFHIQFVYTYADFQYGLYNYIALSIIYATTMI